MTLKNPSKYRLFSLRYILPFFAVFAILSIYSTQKNNVLELSVRIISEDTTSVQVFFDTRHGFNEENKREVLLKGGENKTLRFRLPAATKQIRLDPASNVTKLVIRSLQLTRVSPTDSRSLLPECLEIGQHLSVISQVDKELHLQVLGTDPHIVIPQSCIPEKASSRGDWRPGTTAVLALIVLGLIRVMATLGRRGVPRLLYVVIGIFLFQCLLVALFSQYNIHPDEHGHVIASKFYKDHWFKIAVDQPAMKAALMPGWNFSYLNHPDIVYFLAEKVTAFLKIPLEEDFQRYRLFNFLLLTTLILIFSGGSRKNLYFLLLLGLTPQIWYIFSYFNGDAISLFASMMLGYYYIREREHLEYFFWVKPRLNPPIIIFFFLCVLVLLTRLHYAIFVVFILGLIPLLKPANQEYKNIPKVLLRVILISLCILIVVGLFELKEQSVNNFKKSEAVEAVVEESITNEFSKQQILETGYNPFRLYLMDLGEPITDLLTKHHFLSSSVMSFIGLYGYMNVRSSNAFYWISGIIAFGTVIFLLFVGIWRSGLGYALIVLYSIAAALLVFILSLAHSWMVGYGAQGRYLFAVIPMLAVTLSLSSAKTPVLVIQKLALAVYTVNCIGYAVYGTLPMLNLHL
ncbi:MAG: hypothetical protein KJ630_03060 [Proteobacteria bacterium]|nr:hypothetical protein [Pseudomonadota bacterium]